MQACRAHPGDFQAQAGSWLAMGKAAHFRADLGLPLEGSWQDTQGDSCQQNVSGTLWLLFSSSRDLVS